MKIVIVMSETSMWKPGFIESLIKSLPREHTITAAALTGFGYETYGLFYYLSKYYNILGGRAFVNISLKNLVTLFQKKILRLAGKPERLSIAGVCRIYGIPVHHTRNINNQITIDWLKSFEPDIILSSGHQIFSGGLLSLPKKYCLNRHSSLLPGYRGIYPLFRNLLNDDKVAGVTIHTMEKEIDKGKIVAQKSFPIEPDDTLFSLFGKCYGLSVELVNEAVEKVGTDSWEPVQNNIAPSYYSFPTWEQGRQFRKKGKRIY